MISSSSSRTSADLSCSFVEVKSWGMVIAEAVPVLSFVLGVVGVNRGVAWDCIGLEKRRAVSGNKRG
jgi:hypothetical protein